MTIKNTNDVDIVTGSNMLWPQGAKVGFTVINEEDGEKAVVLTFHEDGEDFPVVMHPTSARDA